jgi:hypothetical protein
LLDRVDVTGQSRERVPELATIEEIHREPVQVLEHPGAQIEHEPLTQPGRQDFV